MPDHVDAIVIFLRFYIVAGIIAAVLLNIYIIRLLQKHDEKVAKIEVLLEDQRSRDLANRGLLALEHGRDQDDQRRKEHRPDVNG